MAIGEIFQIYEYITLFKYLFQAFFVNIIMTICYFYILFKLMNYYGEMGERYNAAGLVTTN